MRQLYNMFYPLCFFMILIFRIPYSQGFVVSDTAEGTKLDLTEEINPEDKNGVFKDISTQQLAEDDALVKSIVSDATEDDNTPEDLVKEAEAQFLSTVMRLVGNGELYRDARIEAITSAMESAFLATSGKVDYEYIEQVLKSIKEKDEQKRRQNEEHEANGLGPSSNDSGKKDSLKHRPVEKSSSGSTVPPTTGKDHDS